jgi:hypothetical protein
MRLYQQVSGLAAGRTAFDGLDLPIRPLFGGRPRFLGPSIHCDRWRNRQPR